MKKITTLYKKPIRVDSKTTLENNEFFSCTDGEVSEGVFHSFEFPNIPRIGEWFVLHNFYEDSPGGGNRTHVLAIEPIENMM